MVKKDNVTIEFHTDEVVEAKVNEIALLLIRFHGHSYEQISFKVTSPAFGGKVYFVKKPAYSKEHVLKVAFLCPGETQS